MILYVIVLNAILGIVLLEWAWVSTANLRVVDEDRDSKYPSRRRSDVNYVQKWKLYPGAVTFLFPRVFMFAFSLIFIYVVGR
jgi:hypothetical protein